MGIEELIKQFDWAKLSFFVLLILPGFISIQVWRLITPTSERLLKEQIPEAIAFGVLNAGVGGPLVLMLAPQNPWLSYALLVFSLVALPAISPFVLRKVIDLMEVRGLVLNQRHNGWDAAFLRREPLFVIVHLKDGRRVGGYYGYESFAGVYPTSGHLYLEELWTLDMDGKFLARVSD